MNKKILIIGINYYPEDSAIGLYTTQKAEYLVQQGFEVSVITGFPYYPQWKIQDAYQQKSYYVQETINNVKVFRFKQYVPQHPSFSKRIFHLISFTLGSLPNLFRVEKPDVVISIVPFTTSVLLGWILKLRYKSKLWVHIQDFEFDAAIDSGLFNSKVKSLFSLLLWIEKKLLSRTNIVSTISYGMLSKLKSKTKTRALYLPNWVDLSIFEQDTHLKHPYLTSSKFKILYSGNIGAKQDWELFVQFVNALKSIQDVEVIVVGEGAEKENLFSQLDKFSFVSHFNLVPYSELPQLLSSANLHVLFQKKEVIDTVMPSKLLGMMASGKPSLVTGHLDSEVAQVLKTSQGGFYLDGKSVKELKQCVLQMINDSVLTKKLGNNAKVYVKNNFSKDKVLSNFTQNLKHI